MRKKNDNIIIYAGSLRPGGGMTVAKLVIEAFAKTNHKVVVYTGAQDLSEGLKEILDTHGNVTERRFFAGTPSFLRYIISKLYFLPIRPEKTFLFSFNYYIPALMKQVVYHIDLSLFLKNSDSFQEKIKQIDAALACRLANVNIFESQYLKDTAYNKMRGRIKQAQKLYIGADPQFFVKNNISYSKNRLLLVSSVQPHKDNKTCIKVLQRLHEIRPEQKWQLFIAGGQSKKQWDSLLSFAHGNNVGEFVQIIGVLNKKQLSEWMTGSLCLISASKIESFCMVALETMAARCPVIVTDRTSMPESVGPAGIIVEAGNVKQFADAILLLAEHADLREEYVRKGIEWATKFEQTLFRQELSKILEKSGLV